MSYMPTVILASASPRRAELLKQLNIPFKVVPSNTHEVKHPELTPHEVSKMNAFRKARTVISHFPDSLVIGADTIVCLGNEILGKPANLEEATQMLSRLQGRSHEVITGVCLLQRNPICNILFSVSTTVNFRPLTVTQIKKYLGMINPLDKAGAYAIQEYGEMLVDSISGSFSNVVGLPLERLREELNKLWQTQGSMQS